MSYTAKASPMLALIVFASCYSSSVFATNGIAPIGLGTEHRAMGGVGAGYPANSSSMASNPAAAAWVKDGFDVGAELFRPDREATFNGKAFGMPADQVFDGNGKKSFLIPEASYKRNLKGGVSLGVAAYGNGGMNTEYAINPGFGQGEAGVDYQQLFVSPTAAFQLNPQHAVGISANMVYHRFKASGLQGFDNAMTTASPGHITNNGYDSSTGIGFAVGWQGKVAPNLIVGAAYRSKVKMGELDAYSGLFANGGEFNVPGAVSVGASWQVTPSTTVAADVQHIYYKDSEAISNSALIQKPFGANGGPGFGWDDMTVYKVGLKQQVNEKMALMAGFNYGKQPIDSAQTTLNVLAPGVVEKHLTLGAQWTLSPKSKLNASYVHAFENEVKGNNSSRMDGYNLKMKQDSLGISYSHEF
ncbi:OmpP1/FadL family transporter [Thiolinea disciformis]|uniref:OmpP1/FadL family transporter n=1 Tax=Thiolinea disciformis TaxID=125614 RepID=UPI0003605F3D|nr:outer membrane protein transport protein [Thiolinea disciformis]